MGYEAADETKATRQDWQDAHSEEPKRIFSGRDRFYALAIPLS
jgi:hypothetical protein